MSLTGWVEEAKVNLLELKYLLMVCDDPKRKRDLRLRIAELTVTIEQAEKWLTSTKTEEDKSGADDQTPQQRAYNRG